MAVDYESDVTFTLKATPEQYSFSLDVLNNPERALMNSKLGYYDLQLLDVNMLRMSGFELYQEIKKMEYKAKACFFTACKDYQ